MGHTSEEQDTDSSITECTSFSKNTATSANSFWERGHQLPFFKVTEENEKLKEKYLVNTIQFLKVLV